MTNLTYRVVLTPDDGGWLVNVPDIPGCVSYGDTIEEAKANAKDTIEAFLGDFLDRGEAFPEPSNDIADDETSQVFEIGVEVPTE